MTTEGFWGKKIKFNGVLRWNNNNEEEKEIKIESVDENKKRKAEELGMAEKRGKLRKYDDNMNEKSDAEGVDTLTVTGRSLLKDFEDFDGHKVIGKRMLKDLIMMIKIIKVIVTIIILATIKIRLGKTKRKLTKMKLRMGWMQERGLDWMENLIVRGMRRIIGSIIVESQL